MSQQTNKPFRTAYSLMIALWCVVITMSWVAFDNVLSDGLLRWHVGHKQLAQGMSEIILLWATLLVLSCQSFRWLMLVPVWLYLRRHHVDWPLFTCLIYLESLLLTGRLTNTKLGIQQSSKDVQTWFLDLLAGLVVTTAIYWWMQVLGFGHPHQLIWVPIILLLVSLAWLRQPPQTFLWIKACIHSSGSANKLAMTGFITLTCMMFAKSNDYPGFDPWWYSFRPEYVLLGEHSVFESLGLISPVHYFPKFWEVFALPMSVFGDTSHISGLSIMVSCLFCLLLHQQMRTIQLSQSVAAWLSLTFGASVMMSGSALLGKPDMFAAFCVVAMMPAITAISKSRHPNRWFAVTLAWAAMAALSKLNVLPYVAVLGLLSLALWFRAWRKQSHHRQPVGMIQSANIWWLVGMLSVTGCLVTARTYWVAGVPTIGPEQLLELWKALGMEPTLPAGSLSWTKGQEWHALPSLLYEWFFSPNDMGAIVNLWPGNVWLACSVVLLPALLVWRIKAQAAFTTHITDDAIWPWLAMFVAGALMLVSIKYMNHGGDGNYFIAPMAAWVLMVAWMLRPWLHEQNRLLIGIFASAMCLVTVMTMGWSMASIGWAEPGTRYWDAEFTRSTKDTSDFKTRRLQAQGLLTIEAFLKQQEDQPWHLLGDSPPTESNMLSARFEEANTIWISNSQLAKSPEAFKTYLGCANIKGMIVGDGDKQFLRIHEQRGWFDFDKLPVLAKDRWTLYDVRGLHLPCPEGWEAQGLSISPDKSN